MRMRVNNDGRGQGSMRMTRTVPPPLPKADAPIYDVSQKQNKRIGMLYLIAALGQLAIVFNRYEAYREVLAWKDGEHALHFAFMTFGIAALYWLIVLAIQGALIVYSVLSVMALIWTAVVYRSSRDTKHKRRWALFSCVLLPCGLLVGLYAIRQQAREPRKTIND